MLLDGSGRRAGHAGGLVDHQRVERAGHRDRRVAAGRVRRVQGRPAGAHPGPRGPVDLAQGHPGQRGRAWLLRLRDDRPVSAWLYRPLRRPDPGRAAGRAGRARRRHRVPRLGRLKLRHRRHAARRRWLHHRLIALAAAGTRRRVRPGARRS